MADTRNFANKVANEGSADVYLEDAKLSEKTSQNSVASTDYVLLEDTDGAYHKIAKNSFDEAVRSSLGSMLMNLDKGTSVAGIPAIGSTGNDLGSVTLSNLAALLGAVYESTTTITDISQLNSINYNTVVRVNIGVLSDTFFSTVFCRTINATWPISFQIEFRSDGSTIRIRMKWFNQNWSSWKEL